MDLKLAEPGNAASLLKLSLNFGRTHIRYPLKNSFSSVSVVA